MISEGDSGNVSHDCEFNHCTINEPNCFKEAANFDEWKHAMQKEYDALIKNGTWRLVDPPIGVKLVVNGCIRSNTKHIALLINTRQDL